MRQISPYVLTWIAVWATVFVAHSSETPGQSVDVKATMQFSMAAESLPTAPRQAGEWKAPLTKLSPEFISAATALFRQGLADPRGCEYREIEVVVGGFEPPWSDNILKTHGWVLPDAGTKTQRFGICWNGLVYPLVSVGKRANLRADALAAAKGEVAGALVGTGRYWAPSYENMCICHPSEQRSVSHESPMPIKACLLLRLGEAELAQNLWTRWMSGLRSYSFEKERYRTVEESVEVNQRELRDPYLSLANCWTLSLFDRAVGAHMRSDDRLSLASAEMLVATWPAVVVEAAKRGFRKPSGGEGQQPPYFLLDANRARDLLADQRRRAEDREKGTLPPLRNVEYPDEDLWETMTINKLLAQCPDRQHRVALLIRELEESCSQTWGAIGFRDPCCSRMLEHGSETLVFLLCKQGEDAVEPLLKCLESDARLSRSSERGQRYPIPVYRFAYPALSIILKMPFDDGEVEELMSDDAALKQRQTRAARMRVYWRRYKDLPQTERWNGVLADDHALSYQWSAAARAVVQPTSVPLSLDSVLLGWGRDSWQPSAKRKMHGESLRSKSEPSVADLMVKRIEILNQPYQRLLARHRQLDSQVQKLEKRVEELSHGSEPGYENACEELQQFEQQRDDLAQLIYEKNSDWVTPFSMACEMVYCLAQWDRTALPDILPRQIELCRRAAADTGSFEIDLERLLHIRRETTVVPIQWSPQSKGNSSTGSGVFD